MIDQIIAKMDVELTDPLYMQEFARLFWNEHEEAEKVGDKLRSLNAKTEANALQSVPKDGVFWPIFIPAGVSHNEAKATVLAQFDDNALDYIESRVQDTKNHILRARYAHVLWVSTCKHQRFARIAIESYLQLVDDALSRETIEEESDRNYSFHGSALLSDICNAYYLARQSGLPRDEIVSTIYELIRTYPSQFSWRIRVRRFLIELMLKERRRDFREINWVSIALICRETADELTADKIFEEAVTFLTLGKRIEVDVRNSGFDWDSAIANVWEKAMNSAGSNLLGCHFCERAIEFYKKTRNNEKVDELMTRFSVMRKGISLSKIEHKIDPSDFLRWCEEVAESFKGRPTEEILAYLIISPAALPNSSIVRQTAADTLGKSVFQRMFHTQILDERGNVAKNVGSDEIDQFQFWQTYRWIMTYEKSPLIDRILSKNICEDGLTASRVIEELSKYSWAFQPLQSNLPGGKMIEYSWSDFLQPLLETYFEARITQEVDAKFKLMLLFVDSATMKIEGMLRDMVVRMGLPSFMLVRDHKGNTVQRERDIDNLLCEPRIEKLLGEDIANYLRFVFIEHAGLKFRHRVAHSLMFPGEYHSGTADTIFLAILRLCNYVIEKVAPSEQQTSDTSEVVAK